jgi:hypothetical protein
MPHLATDRISRGLRWAGASLLVLAALLVILAIGWTRSVEALITASAVAFLALGAPGAAAFAMAVWLEHAADRIEHEAIASEPPRPADRNPFREPLRRYVIAVAAVAAAWGARYLLDIVAPGQVPFITFFLAVMVAGWSGGFGPAAFATLLSLMITWQFYVSPAQYFNAPDLGRYVVLGLFVLVCLGVAAIAAALHAALDRTQHLADRVRELEAQRRGEPPPGTTSSS